MKTAVAFAFGFGTGMLCLALVLWSTGRLTTGTTQAARNEPSTYTAPAPISSTESPVAGKSAPALPPAPETVPQRTPELPEVVRAPAPVGAPQPSGGPSLGMPIAGVDPHTLQSTFTQGRNGHAHEALDIMADRGTPVHAVAEGNVVKLFTSKQGGLTVYQFDNSRTWCFYYAHLDRYAAGLKEGMLLRTGDVLGYVGSTGDASAEAPHLHLAVFRLGPEKKWWQGTALDPLPLLK